MHILGISCFYHDAAAALIKDGGVVAGAAEERFTGKKHDPDFPINAIRFCIEKTGIAVNDLDYIVFYDKPLVKFDRILSSYMQTAPRSYAAFRRAVPLWLREKLWIPQLIKKKLGYEGKILFTEHHFSHAAGTYLSSPFNHAAILTVDGVGEWATASIGIGKNNKVEILKTMNFPHSLGLLYSTFTYLLGFQVNSSEYKVMGLASYGRPEYRELIEKELVTIHDDGSITLNMKYFNFHRGLTMSDSRLEKILGFPRRSPGEELTDNHRNLAASIQAVTEKILLKMAEYAKNITGAEYLCLSGGVALNCAAAGKLLESSLFRDVYIQPASSDSGGAIGAGLYVYYGLNPDTPRTQQNYLSLGPEYSSDEISAFLESNKIPHEELSQTEIAQKTAMEIASGKIAAIFHGPMEFGPRALGFRSIFADPRDPEMKARINKAVKFREPFRPFAPIVLEEKTSEYFACDRPSPYMLFNFEVRPDKREKVPAVTHIDGTARIQTVNPEQNRFAYEVLKSFEQLTGIPVLLNTSFNLRGHPIVRTPAEAFATFISSGIDLLVIENCLIDKNRVNIEKYSQFRIESGTD